VFYSPHGLESWELVAASGLFALGLLTVFTTIGAVLALLLIRDRHPATARATQFAPVKAVEPAAPAVAQPEYAAASA
jgi:hypothetical protein